MSILINSNNQDAIYNDCGHSKTCFGIPNNCIETRSCVSFTAVKVEGRQEILFKKKSIHIQQILIFSAVQGDKYIFEMRSPPQAAYIATGLSFDVSVH